MLTRKGLAAFAAAVVLGLTLVLPPASAQQPTSVNPTASSVQEQQLLGALKPGDNVRGRCTLPDDKACTLIQPEGRDWRRFHEVTLRWIAAISIVGTLLALVVFYLWRGMVRLEHGRSGRTVVRFNGFERFVHWMTAVCFIILALSGLNITFGKVLLWPLMSPETFTALSQYAKYAHNYLSFPFTIGVVLIFLMWIGGNLPDRADGQWVREGFGGIVKPGTHPPAYRFNTGQKLIYWIVVLGGAAVAISGYIMMFPFYATGIQGMQTAQIVHSIVAVLFVAAMLGHIYIGTIGMEGAFEAMGSGRVDLNWAKEHHSLWLEEQQLRTGPNEAQPQPHGAPHATPAE